MKLIDLSGMKFDRLKVICRTKTEKGRVFWLCQCKCGNVKEVSGKELTRGTTKSCGCLRKETASKNFTTHGATETRLYYIWTTMIQRCEKPSTKKSKKDYKERGITVCPGWHNFETFQSWALANGYSENLTIERMDNDKGYSPDNCKWATNKEQANNRRSNVNITFNGITQTIAQWAEELCMAYNVLHNRLSYLGWSVEKALTTPVRGRV